MFNKRLPLIAVFFPCFHFSLPLTSLLKYVLFSSTCFSVMTCIEIGYRNNFITHSCTRCIYSCAINLSKKSLIKGALVGKRNFDVIKMHGTTIKIKN